jgi:hypothetical protein
MVSGWPIANPRRIQSPEFTKALSIDNTGPVRQFDQASIGASRHKAVDDGQTLRPVSRTQTTSGLFDVHNDQRISGGLWRWSR